MEIFPGIRMGDTVSFTVYPKNVIGTDFKNCVIQAVLDADSAKAHIDPVHMHSVAYPTLPPGTPDDYQAYSYLKVKLANGKVTAVGLPWVEVSTVERIDSRNCHVELADVSSTDVQRIHDLLSANGYSVTLVKLV